MKLQKFSISNFNIFLSRLISRGVSKSFTLLPHFKSF
nr:MAG TPA: hypothetical protein [Caudoviricetes sp.]